MVLSGSKPHILIAGGGIGGMCAAAALLKRGFDVDIFEQAGELREIGAGIQISPNGNRALDAVGAFEALKELSCKAERKEIRLWNSGKTWKLFDLGPVAVERYGYPYMTVYRPDLLKVLTDAVLRLKPDAIHLNSRCASFEERDGKVTLTMEGGKTVTGDALIGCDGVNSMVRRLIVDDAPPEYANMMIWRGVIPLKALPERMQVSMAVNWVGPNGHVVHYPLREGELFNLAATVEKTPWNESSYVLEGSHKECHEDFAGWHDDIHTMIDAAPKLVKWAYLLRKPLNRYTFGNVCLLGDACHPTLPFLAQGAVMALEDGVILARCLEQYGDVAAALLAYEKARLVRDNRMVQGSWENTARFHNDAYKNPDDADTYINREWSQAAIADRYEWLFTYNVDTVPV
jgi:salicylate hydroxylase